MLACLQMALAGGLSSFFARAMLLSHIGFFLLWQPVVHASKRISPVAAGIIILCGAALFLFESGWLTVLWIAGLIGILGGRVVTAPMPRLRWFYLLALTHLLILFLMWAVPTYVAGAPIPALVSDAVAYGPVLLLVAMALLPIEADSSDPGQVIDFFYGLLLFLLAVVLALGSVALKSRFEDYYVSLAITIMAAGIALLVLALLWNPGFGSGGLQTYFTRYLLSVG